MTAIDDYANSMFRFETLHDVWIDKCAGYLKHVFGDRLAGKTVIDYAFGRGNWSVAFLRAGAARVVAIDASAANVARFSDYCRQQGLQAIEVICGNVVDETINMRGDILWLYGILQHIEHQREFIEAVTSLVPGPESLIFAYGYNKHSIREFVVDRTRAEVVYNTEAEFRAESLRYTPAARMRARDDLTAPTILWYTARSLARGFEPFEFAPIDQFQDFRFWLSNYSDAEFAPVHLLLARRPMAPSTPLEPPQHFSKDILLLRSMWDQIVPMLGRAERRDLAITAFNTHFSHMTADGAVEDSIIQQFLLLLYAFRAQGARPETVDSPDVAMLLRTAEAAISNAPREIPAGWEDVFLLNYLGTNAIRI